MSDREVDHYGSQYSHFATRLYREIRTEAFDEDFGQNGWITAAEHDLFIEWLELSSDDLLLDIACGAGGPALRVARITGCAVHGVDIHEGGIAAARAAAVEGGLRERAVFDCIDAGTKLPFGSNCFDAITCIDAINHLPGRSRVLAEWYRVLKPGGRLLFTDPVVVTGILTKDEIATRSSIGFFLFAPDGEDQRLLEEAGFVDVRKVDRTENMAHVARRRRTARQARAEALRRAEGVHFEGQQRFFEVCARLADERRLSRHAYVAVKAPR